MDLTASLPDPTGIDPMPEAVVHWSGLSIEPDAKAIRVTYLIYRDTRAREAGRRLVEPLEYTLSGADYDAYIAAHPEVVATIQGLVTEFARTRLGLADAAGAGG